MNGIITKGIGGFYYVRAEDGMLYECRARGIFRKDGITPMIGDRVRIEIDGERGSVAEIFPRKSKLIRPPVANVDTLIVVIAAASPMPNMPTADKLILSAEAAGIEPVICVNKIDIKAPDEICAAYKDSGYRIFRVSAKENAGIDELTKFLRGRVAAFAGLSGVGKSSLLNIIANLNEETGEVSRKILRGRHTTRHVELFELPDGGWVLDTPGFSSIDLPESVTSENLWTYFPEMRDAGDKCRFRGCSHISEPSCAVKEKLADGDLPQSRYESYKEIYEILKNMNDWSRK